MNIEGLGGSPDGLGVIGGHKFKAKSAEGSAKEARIIEMTEENFQC